MPERYITNEVGASEYRIFEPFKGYVLTPQVFSTSNLALGLVRCRSGCYSVPEKRRETKRFCQAKCFRHACRSELELIGNTQACPVFVLGID